MEVMNLWCLRSSAFAEFGRRVTESEFMPFIGLSVFIFSAHSLSF